MSAQPEPVEDIDDSLEPLLAASLLPQAAKEVIDAEEEAKQANTRRKAARNRFAELVQALGVTGFSMGPGQ